MKKFFSFLITGIIIFILYLPGSALGQTKSIDCDIDPSISHSSWTIFSHQRDGEYKFNTSEAVTKLVQMGTPNHAISGKEMLKKLNGTGLNACVADFLLDHQELIPEAWNGKGIVFAGTIFKDPSGNECLRCLKYWDNSWHMGVVYLEEEYDDKYAAIK